MPQKTDEGLKFLAKKHIIDEEGLKKKPYRDTVGKLTVGVGHNLDDGRTVPSNVVDMVLRNAEWPLEAVEALFEYDYGFAESDSITFVNGGKSTAPGAKHWENLTDNRKIAVIGMAFNLGFSRLSKFTKFVGALQKGDYDKASAELLNSKAAQQLPKRYARLAKMIREG